MKYKIAFIAFSLAAPLFVALPAAAETTGDEGFSTGNVRECEDKQNTLGNCVDTSFDFGNGGNGENLGGLLTTGIQFLTALVGIAVLGGILWGAITIARAEGNPATSKKGITIIVNAILGLVLYLLMFAAIQFLVPGGVFR